MSSEKGRSANLLLGKRNSVVEEDGKAWSIMCALYMTEGN